MFVGRPPPLTPVAQADRDLVITTQLLAAGEAYFSQVVDEVAGTLERVVNKNGSPIAEQLPRSRVD